MAPGKENGTVPDSFFFFGCTSPHEFEGQAFTVARLLSHSGPGDSAKVEEAPGSDLAGNTVDILNDPEVRSLERLLRVNERLDNAGLSPVRLPKRSLPVRRRCDRELSESRAASRVPTLFLPKKQVSQSLRPAHELACMLEDASCCGQCCAPSWV